MMAKQKTYTQDELELARQKLSELPDLSRNKIGQTEALEQLKEQIVLLSNQKGYSVTEIREALKSVGILVTANAINDLLAVRKRVSAKKKPAAE
ncbi:mobilization protein [Pseudomonas ovata]|uniref:mobilization protein n=1 Tax=Pseudomonas ovata TaxID=1839709 RepID=UPI001F4DE9AF|nr:mobilization protein [Pseudomonas ovata]